MSQGRRDKIWCEKCFKFRILVAVHPMGRAPGVLKGNVRIETFTAGSVVCTVAVATARNRPQSRVPVLPMPRSVRLRLPTGSIRRRLFIPAIRRATDLPKPVCDRVL